MSTSFWKNRNVFLTGHTGFKGGWTALWLSHLGAKVTGFSLDPPTSPNFFNEINLSGFLSDSIIGDIRDFEKLSKAIKDSKPSIIFHMAAQPLVRESYLYPLETFQSNVIGTANLLQSAREIGSLKAVVNITTDKCYENKEWIWSYRENDRLGGYDPYSNSKACAELVIDSFRKSFFKESDVGIASARAGNVIGGGDWARDRLLPDFFRSFEANKSLLIRSPNSIRPWQHVLEPISGYLCLAQKLAESKNEYDQAWNFGPEEHDSKSVSWIADRLCKKVSGSKWELDEDPQLHEAENLKLDSSKAKKYLNWKPKLNLNDALEMTVDWFMKWKEKGDIQNLSIDQIENYSNL